MDMLFKFLIQSALMLGAKKCEQELLTQGITARVNINLIDIDIEKYRATKEKQQKEQNKEENPFIKVIDESLNDI